MCSASCQVVLGLAPPTAVPPLYVNQPDTGFASDQSQQLELLMQQHKQQQGGLSPGSSAAALNRAASSNTSLGSSSQHPTAAGGATGGAGDDQQAGNAAAAAAAAGAGSAGGNGSDTGVSSSVAAAGAAAGGAAQPSPKQQRLVSPTAMPMPRMSNAFARKHGLDPKENPLVNLQRLAMQQQVAPQGPPAMVGGQGGAWGADVLQRTST